eukprot:5047849-Prymnesium_polylepis.1
MGHCRFGLDSSSALLTAGPAAPPRSYCALGGVRSSVDGSPSSSSSRRHSSSSSRAAAARRSGEKGVTALCRLSGWRPPCAGPRW